MSRETPPPPSDIPRNLSYIASLYERAFYASQSPSAEEEEEEEEEEERGRGRLTVTRRRRPRARSLPARPDAGRSRSPDTRKRVRFADSLGLELTSVRSFSRYEAPRVPGHVQAKLQRDAIRHFQSHCGGLAFK
ncbi:protein phosphatase 1 regulatory subunit 3E-like, partial [Chiloscyllium plagiosum]|uniref:protein phosphatase 1 regulatory subunit 3E-like n=1 Tax=Chiloscyllium plagiosum TaxID=36176 RepID=UPI001CB7EAFA